MFLPSQLIEISQRFQPDIEDLQVLLQEEGLPVGSPESLDELSSRLHSDARFRRDIAFLVRSILYRQPDEPGSLDVLGILVVAAAGTRQQFDSGSRHELLRDLLRFVAQQRRAGAAPPAVEPERHSPAPAIVSRPVAPRTPEPQAAPTPTPVPLLTYSEPEPPPRRSHAVWIIAVVALLAGLGTGLAIRRNSSSQTHLATAAPPAASSPSPAVPEPEAPAALPRSRHNLPRAATRYRTRRAERTQASVPPTLATNTPAKPIESPHPAPPATAMPIQPARPNPAQSALQRPESAAATPPANVVRQPSAPAPANVFAHPEAASAAASLQQPAPSFSHPKDPVLIARNTTPRNPAAAAKPELQGTVHAGSTGTMASNLMYSPEPDYPAEAIAAGVQGQVTVRAVVGPHGNVINAEVVSGPPMLRDTALQAVARWRFRPYEEDGKPTAIATTAILDFQIPPKK